MKSFLRSPVLHFLVLGGVLFAIDAARSSKPAPPPPPPVSVPATAPTGPIVVDAEVTQRMTAAAQRRLGRPPTPPEIDAEIQRYIDEEILFREALARGLERDDPMIHERIAARMSYVLSEAAVIPEPSDAQLRTWFDAHADRYNAPERIDFTHVFIADGDAARADALAAQLTAGAPPETLGDTFSGGRKYRGRKRVDLAESFGSEFADGLDKQPANAWVRRRSRHGTHLVRVDKVEAARSADFESAKLELRREWVEDQRRIASEAALKQLRAHWEVERR
jgi:parvulin-like peptidyl-prolyl isomerase